MRYLVGCLVILLVGTTAWSDELFDFSQPLAEGEAQIIYLYHSGWLVRTANHLMVFDYDLPTAPPNVRLKKQPWFIDGSQLAGHDVTVFVSHGHGDHFEEAVFYWRKNVENIRYVMGWPYESNAEDVISFPFERTTRSVNGIEVTTIVHDWHGIPESAFLVSVDGLNFYHGGDLSVREANPDYEEKIGYLAGLNKEIDFCFVPVWGEKEVILRLLEPGYTFPMHSESRDSLYLDFAHEAEELNLPTTVIPAEKSGEIFYYLNGAILRGGNPYRAVKQVK